MKSKTPRKSLVFEWIGKLTPSVCAIEILGLKDQKGYSKKVDEYATTLKNFIFHRLGNQRKSSS